jgi:hypothetical protein
MPRILTKLRVDEVSAVTRGAGEGTRIVLMKRHDDSDSFYTKLFRGVSKNSGRVVRPPRRLRGRDQLRDIADAKHALLFSPDGRGLMRDTPNTSIDELASHLLEASGANINKRNEDNMQTFVKEISDLGEHGFVKMVTSAAKQQYPQLTREQAFTKLFTEDGPAGEAVRYFRQISKQAPAPDEAWQARRAAALRRATRQDPLDDDEADAEGKKVVSTALGDEADALDELEWLAVARRKLDPSLTKAQAFAKVYQDPDNARLVQRERMQNRPR